jgi:hypothetical protein
MLLGKKKETKKKQKKDVGCTTLEDCHTPPTQSDHYYQFTW